MNREYNIKKINDTYRTNKIIIDIYNKGLITYKDGYNILDYIHLFKLIGLTDNQIKKYFPSYISKNSINYDEIIDLFIVPDSDGYGNKLYFYGNKYLRDVTSHIPWIQYMYNNEYSEQDKREFLQLQGVSLDFYQTLVDDYYHINEVYSHYYNQEVKQIYIDGVLKNHLT